MVSMFPENIGGKISGAGASKFHLVRGRLGRAFFGAALAVVPPGNLQCGFSNAREGLSAAMNSFGAVQSFMSLSLM